MELLEIFSDLSVNGEFTKFYLDMQLAMNQYSDKRINEMKNTLKYVYPDKLEEINHYDKLRVLYEFSLLI